MKLNDLRNIIREEIQFILNEISVLKIKNKILNFLKLKEIQKYKIDNYFYENIPFSVFKKYGISISDLKAYDTSTDIVTFDLEININYNKKIVNVFLQK